MSVAVGQGIGPLKGFSASFQTVVVLGAEHRVLCWNRRREQRRLARVLTQMSAREQRCHVITREGRPGHERALDSAERPLVRGIRHERRVRSLAASIAAPVSLTSRIACARSSPQPTSFT